MNIFEMRTALGDTQKEFSMRYDIPFRTIQNWETGVRNPPQYILKLLEKSVRTDLINRKTIILPTYDSKKIDLPNRSDYLCAVYWLEAVRECIGEPFVFALDEALMCQGYFGGRNNEFLVWVYGNDALRRFNGVVVLGDYVSPYHIKEKNGLQYTDFNRTVIDALANEEILDMQGITEALSMYYFCNGECFEGMFVPPEYQDLFNKIAFDAIDYYNS